MSSLFHSTFYQPLLNVLGALILVLPGSNLGVAIVVFTIFINFLLLPITHKAKKSQRKMQELQPEMDRIKTQYKDKRDEQARQMLELYKEHGINPFFNILMLFIQIPIFFAIFRILKNEAYVSWHEVYSFLPTLPTPEHMFLGVDLTHPSIIFAVFAAIAQFVQITLMTKGTQTTKDSKKTNDESFNAAMQKNMRFMMPAFILIAGLSLPAALALYWTVMSLFGIVHEGIVYRQGISKSTANGTN